MTDRRVQCPVDGCFRIIKANNKNVGIHLRTMHPDLDRKEHDSAWTKMLGVPPNCPKFLRPKAAREGCR